MGVIRLNLDKVEAPLFPAITQSTLEALRSGSVRCLNSRFFPSEEEAISILEFAARVCYKSDTKKRSPLVLIKNIYEKRHWSVFEHVNFSFLMGGDFSNFQNFLLFIKRVDKWSFDPLPSSFGGMVMVTCNIRSFLELCCCCNSLAEYKLGGFKCDIRSIGRGIYHAFAQTYPKLADLFGNFQDPHPQIEAISNPEDIPPLIRNRNIRFVFHVLCTRAIANQIVRHRTLSFSQESLRWIRYNKDGNSDLALYFSEAAKAAPFYVGQLESAGKMAMELYCQSIGEGIKPEDARDVLPLGTKTEIVVSGMYNTSMPHFLYEGFARFLDLRLDGHAQPAIREIAKKILAHIQKADRA